MRAAGADPAAERALYAARAGLGDAKFNSKAGQNRGSNPESMSEVSNAHSHLFMEVWLSGSEPTIIRSALVQQLSVRMHPKS